MKRIFAILILMFPLLCQSQNFPFAKKTPTTITKHKISFQDNYTWLENMESEEVANWVHAQNEVANLHLEEIKKTWSSAAKIKEYDTYSSNALPRKKGSFFYGLYRKDKNRPAALYYRKTINDIPIEIADPYKIYRDENAYITDYFPSKSSRLIALKITLNGSDRTDVRFADIHKQTISDEVLTNSKTSNIAWNQDIGVFYKKNANARVFEKDSTFQLYYHKIGTQQQEDQLIFDTAKSENSFSFRTVQNKLLITETKKDEGPKSYYQASLTAEPFTPVKYLEDDTGFIYLGYRDGRVYFSSKEFDWGEIRSFDINNRSDEKIVVPQIYTHLLADSYFFEEYIVCSYKTLGRNYMIVYDKNGAFIRKFDVPYGMDFTVNFINSETKNLFVSFYSYTIPYLNYTLNIETGKSNPFFTEYLPPKPTLFPLDYFETKTLTCKSRDNQDVPVTIVYKKGLVLDGNNPMLLKAYGGYGIVSGPSYDTGLLYFLEKGGVYAYAHVRGGGEKGLKWHQGGKGINKGNTFNDFIDVAEFLIAEKYTSPTKLAITGTSHGGLVVAAAMVKRPELFKVVIPRMGPMDMATYGKFTSGVRNYPEYGNPELEDEYKSLLSFSPYQNIKEDVNYPVTLIITSENDDRVAPAHSYKFAALLQSRPVQKNPIYLKTLGGSGHSGKVSTYASRVNEKADFYNFILFQLNHK